MSREKNFLIILAIFLSFLTVVVLEKNIFLGATPKIRPNWAKNFFNKIYLALSYFKNSQKASNLSVSPATENKKENNIFLKTIAKGIYAKTNDKNMEILVKVLEVDWVEYEIKEKGIKIKVPKNQTIPKEFFVDF